MSENKYEVNHTGRGFAKIEFTDRYDVACSLQESSLATEAAIWFGCNDANPRQFIPGKDWQPVEMPAEYTADTRMHLTQEQVASLLPILQNFAATGEISTVSASASASASTAQPEAVQAEPVAWMREAVARAIWNIRREDEDRCDMELEDMGEDHSVWREADAVLSALPPAQQVEKDTYEYGWLIENGKQGDELRYRTMDQGLPIWTADHMVALRFARRADAELFAAEDEDAWGIVEHAWIRVDAAIAQKEKDR